MRKAVLFVSALLLFCAESGASERSCEAALGEQTTGRLFGALRGGRTQAHCVLDSVRTEREHTALLWTREGQALPPLVLRPLECSTSARERGATLALDPVPAVFEQQCPEAVQFVATVVRDFRSRTVPEPHYWPRWRAQLALVVTLFAFLWMLREVSKKTEVS